VKTFEIFEQAAAELEAERTLTGRIYRVTKDGYGFIRGKVQDKTTEFFVHPNDFVSSDISSHIRAGLTVRFSRGFQTGHLPKAVNVIAVLPDPVPPTPRPEPKPVARIRTGDIHEMDIQEAIQEKERPAQGWRAGKSPKHMENCEQCGGRHPRGKHFNRPGALAASASVWEI
jgi:'Cold-shock' DNA-binding domain